METSMRVLLQKQDSSTHILNDVACIAEEDGTVHFQIKNADGEKFVDVKQEHIRRMQVTPFPPCYPAPNDTPQSEGSVYVVTRTISGVIEEQQVFSDDNYSFAIKYFRAFVEATNPHITEEAMDQAVGSRQYTKDGIALEMRHLKIMK